jgi:hypothetical protein
LENNEYGKLIDFLGKKFEKIDEKFEKIDKRFDAMEEKFATKADLKDSERRTGILIEEVNHKIDLVIEGQQGIIQKLDRHIDENESEHKRLEHMVMEDRADIYNIKKRLS